MVSFLFYLFPLLGRNSAVQFYFLEQLTNDVLKLCRLSCKNFKASVFFYFI